MREKRMRFKSGSYCRSFSFKSKKKERKKYIFLLTAIYTFSFDFFKKSPLLSSRSKRKEKKKKENLEKRNFYDTRCYVLLIHNGSSSSSVTL